MQENVYVATTIQVIIFLTVCEGSAVRTFGRGHSEREGNDFDLFPVGCAGCHRAAAATPWLQCNYITPEEFPGKLCMEKQR